MQLHPHLQELGRLEHTWKVADARLTVAKHLGFVIAVLAAAFVSTKWHAPSLAFFAGAAAYGLALLPYWQPASAAKDEFFRAAKIGKYEKNPFEPES